MRIRVDLQSGVGCDVAGLEVGGEEGFDGLGTEGDVRKGIEDRSGIVNQSGLVYKGGVGEESVEADGEGVLYGKICSRNKTSRERKTVRNEIKKFITLDTKMITKE